MPLIIVLQDPAQAATLAILIVSSVTSTVQINVCAASMVNLNKQIITVLVLVILINIPIYYTENVINVQLTA